MTNNLFLTPSKLAKRYGVSLPTFLEWLKPIVADNDDINIFYEADWSLFEETHNIKDVKFRCKYKTINPEEIRTISLLIADPDFNAEYKKTTISSLAKEAGISIKTAVRITTRHRNQQPQRLFALKHRRKSKCLTPKEVKTIRKLFGIDHY